MIELQIRTMYECTENYSSKSILFFSLKDMLSAYYVFGSH